MRSAARSALVAAALAVASAVIYARTPETPPSKLPESGAVSGAAAIDPEILRLREAAWRAWFAGDEATLREILPPEFIGIDMGDGPFSDLATTLAEARAFHTGGGRLASLEFPETRAQRFGDVVVLYGRFSVVLDARGQTSTLAGRLTEIFVRRGDRWWHPGWHLDLNAGG